MKEILFKAQIICSEEWIEGSLILELDKTMIFETNASFLAPAGIYIGVEVKRETVCQFTGLTDKNGKKIFSGHLFKLGAEKDIFEVRFEYGCFMAFSKGKQYGLIGELQSCFIDVIGNIFDNPELLIQ